MTTIAIQGAAVFSTVDEFEEEVKRNSKLWPLNFWLIIMGKDPGRLFVSIELGDRISCTHHKLQHRLSS